MRNISTSYCSIRTYILFACYGLLFNDYLYWGATRILTIQILQESGLLHSLFVRTVQFVYFKITEVMKFLMQYVFLIQSLFHMQLQKYLHPIQEVYKRCITRGV